MTEKPTRDLPSSTAPGKSGQSNQAVSFRLTSLDRIAILTLLFWIGLGLFLSNLQFDESGRLLHHSSHLPVAGIIISCIVGLTLSRLSWGSKAFLFLLAVVNLAAAAYLVSLEGHWSLEEASIRRNSGDPIALLSEVLKFLLILSGLACLVRPVVRKLFHGTELEEKYRNRIYLLVVGGLFLFHFFLTLLEQNTSEPCLSIQLFGATLAFWFAVLICILCGSFIFEIADHRIRMVLSAATIALLIMVAQHADDISNFFGTFGFITLAAVGFATTLILFPVSLNFRGRFPAVAVLAISLVLMLGVFYLQHDMVFLARYMDEKGVIQQSAAIRKIEAASDVDCRIVDYSFDNGSVIFRPNERGRQRINLSALNSIFAGTVTAFVDQIKPSTNFNGSFRGGLCVAGEMNAADFSDLFLNQSSARLTWGELHLVGEAVEPRQPLPQLKKQILGGKRLFLGGGRLTPGSFAKISECFRGLPLSLRINDWEPSRDDLMAFASHRKKVDLFVFHLKLDSSIVELAVEEGLPIRCIRLEMKGESQEEKRKAALRAMHVVGVIADECEDLPIQEMSKFVITQFPFRDNLPFRLRRFIDERLADKNIENGVEEIQWVLNSDSDTGDIRSFFLPTYQFEILKEIQGVRSLKTLILDGTSISIPSESAQQANPSFISQYYLGGIRADDSAAVDEQVSLPSLEKLFVYREGDLDVRFGALPNLRHLQIRHVGQLKLDPEKFPKVETLVLGTPQGPGFQFRFRLRSVKVPRLKSLKQVQLVLSQRKRWWRWVDLFNFEKWQIRFRFDVPWHVDLKIISEQEFEEHLSDLSRHRVRLVEELDRELGVHELKTGR